MMKIDGKRAVRTLIGSCSKAFHDNRRNRRGTNASATVIHVLEMEDVNSCLVLRLLGGVNAIVSREAEIVRMVATL